MYTNLKTYTKARSEHNRLFMCHVPGAKEHNRLKRKVIRMKLGFIGTGNMASAIMGGIIKNNVIPAEEIIGADLFAPGRERVQKEYGINVTADNKEVAQKAETIILSVKPQFMRA